MSNVVDFYLDGEGTHLVSQDIKPEKVTAGKEELRSIWIRNNLDISIDIIDIKVLDTEKIQVVDFPKEIPSNQMRKLIVKVSPDEIETKGIISQLDFNFHWLAEV